MPQASYGVSLSIGGVSIQKSVSRSADSLIAHEVSLPVGKAGTLSTRTDDNTGEATLGASHGIETADIVDVYWNGGVRYGMTVGTVAGLAVPLDGGSGDNLPTAATALVVTKQVSINTAIDGDELEIIGIVAEALSQTSTAKAHVDMQSSAPASIEAISLNANVPMVYDIAAGISNPFTGNPIVTTKASNGSATEVLTLKIIGLVDGTP